MQNETNIFLINENLRTDNMKPTLYKGIHTKITYRPLSHHQARSYQGHYSVLDWPLTQL
jgi:hypothetical protein